MNANRLALILVYARPPSPVVERILTAIGPRHP